MSDTAGSLPQAEEIEKKDTQASTFVAEFEKMDLSKLYDLQFLVAANKGDRNKGNFLTNTVKGPYNFAEMVQAVSSMHTTHVHHAKVIVCDTNVDARVKFLDAGTIDYLEAHATDIIFDATIGAQIMDNITCEAGIAENDKESAPTKE